MSSFEWRKIDKCDFCGRKAEYTYKRIKFLSIARGFMCEKHKQEIINAVLKEKWF